MFEVSIYAALGFHVLPVRVVFFKKPVWIGESVFKLNVVNLNGLTEGFKAGAWIPTFAGMTRFTHLLPR